MSDSTIQFLLTAHLLLTAAMTGLIWFVQVVHYPLFAQVGTESFVNYGSIHVRRTTWIVAPLMLGEVVVTVALLFAGFASWKHVAAIACVALLAINWVSTALLQVPCHRKLEAGFDAATHQQLVRTNWVRTAAWTAKCLVAAALVV